MTRSKISGGSDILGRARAPGRPSAAKRPIGVRPDLAHAQAATALAFILAFALAFAFAFEAVSVLPPATRLAAGPVSWR